ncbi:transposase [Streptomyces lunaelactis]|nr:transposase [Streptomyces lunaelactis]
MLCGILFIFYTGIRWEWMPSELGFGSGMTCWRRLRDWHNAGVWQRLHEALLAELRAADLLDVSRAVIDSSHIRASRAAPKPDGARSAEARPGSKHHLIWDATGIPLAVTPTGGSATRHAAVAASCRDPDHPRQTWPSPAAVDADPRRPRAQLMHQTTRTPTRVPTP